VIRILWSEFKVLAKQQWERPLDTALILTWFYFWFSLSRTRPLIAIRIYMKSYKLLRMLRKRNHLQRFFESNLGRKSWLVNMPLFDFPKSRKNPLVTRILGNTITKVWHEIRFQLNSEKQAAIILLQWYCWGRSQSYFLGVEAVELR